MTCDPRVLLRAAAVLLLLSLRPAAAPAQALGFGPPAPLDSNAATDSGDDRFPDVATDGAGNWVAVWASLDSLGGTIDTDADILLSTSNSVPVELSGFALD